MAVYIICEFNPFHFGHEYLIKQVKARFPGQPVVCIMSGNFVQRGECACIDKYDRARLALSGGANLVLLLPAPYSFASAEYFASAAVYISGSLSAEPSVLAFGSELGDAGALSEISDKLQSADFKVELDRLTRGKMPFAKARQAAYEKLRGDASDITTPNNILALEYIAAIKKYGFPLEAFTVKREPRFPSAAEIRIKAGTPGFCTELPEYAREVFERAEKEGYFPADMENAYRVASAYLRSHGESDAADGEGGLYRRIASAAGAAGSFSELISEASSSAYTNARVRRVILNALLGITKALLSSPPAYTLLLAADKIGLDHLGQIKKTSKIPILTKPADALCACHAFALEVSADNLYALSTPRLRENNFSLRQSPYIEK